MRRVERLDLSFRNWEAIVLEDILRESNIEGCEFKVLKDLRLKNLVLSDQGIKLFIRTCPSLKALRILWPIRKSDMEIICDTLRSLHLCYWDKQYTTKIYAPNLTSIDFAHVTKRLYLENVPKLVHFDCSIKNQSTRQNLDKLAASLESLVLQITVPKVPQSFAKMPKLKKFHIAFAPLLGVFHKFFLAVARLLHASPCLVELQISIFPIKGAIYVPNDNSPHDHLEVFEFSGFHVDADDQIELLRYILDNCISLKRVCIRPELPQFSDYDTTKKYTRQLLAAKFKVHDHIKLSIV